MTDHRASDCASLLARAEAEHDRLAEELRKAERDYRAVLEERDAARAEVGRMQAELKEIECPDCDGWGYSFCKDGYTGRLVQLDCPSCHGTSVHPIVLGLLGESVRLSEKEKAARQRAKPTSRGPKFED